jgi:hypothetical protein
MTQTLQNMPVGETGPIEEFDAIIILAKLDIDSTKSSLSRCVLC